MWDSRFEVLFMSLIITIFLSINLLYANQWRRDFSIGSPALDTTSILDLNSTTHGSRPCPSMTGAERDLISSPATGLCVYNITTSEYNQYNGVSWVSMGGGAGGDLWSDPVDADIVPDANNTRDLGSTATSFELSYIDKVIIANGSGVAGLQGELSRSTNEVGFAGLTLTTSALNIPTTIETSASTGADANDTAKTYVLSGRITNAGSTGDTGNIHIEPGTNAGSGARGQLQIIDGSEGTIGDVWTSTGVNGEGNWSSVSPSLDDNLQVIGGGVWSFDGTNVALSQDAFVQYGPYLDNRNTIAAQSFALSDDQVAYVDINKTTDSESTLTVNTVAIGSYVDQDDRKIIARRKQVVNSEIVAQQQSVNTSDIVLSPSNPASWRAQGFTTIGAGVAKTVKFRLFADAAVNGTFDIAIQGDSAGEPDGTDLDSLTINPDDLPTSAPGAYQEYEYTAGTANLANSTIYHYVFKATNLTGSGNVRIEYSNAGHAGTFRVSPDSGATWNPDFTSVDLTHELIAETTHGSVVTIAKSLSLRDDEDGLITDGTSVIKRVTADPCTDTVIFPEAKIFYNDTSDYFCFCDGAGADVQMHSPATACF